MLVAYFPLFTKISTPSFSLFVLILLYVFIWLAFENLPIFSLSIDLVYHFRLSIASYFDRICLISGKYNEYWRYCITALESFNRFLRRMIIFIFICKKSCVPLILLVRISTSLLLRFRNEKTEFDTAKMKRMIWIPFPSDHDWFMNVWRFNMQQNALSFWLMNGFRWRSWTVYSCSVLISLKKK